MRNLARDQSIKGPTRYRDESTEGSRSDFILEVRINRIRRGTVLLANATSKGRPN